jgi:superoxide reductase
MMCEPTFYRCALCGNIVGLIQDGGGELVCCGQPMGKLEPNTSDGAAEKHVPQAVVSGDTVSVKLGSVPHPMIEAHYIMWIYLFSEAGGARRCLQPGDAPEAEFVSKNGKPLAVYAYCNLHGLWKADL